MKVIQSFALFDEGSPYMQNDNNKRNVYLNFYTFLLSYLTLKKHYGKVIMYCNQQAYDTFIKYIPYDEVIIKKNKNGMDFWNVYKIDIMKLQNEDFIHVDSDVFIFDNLFDEFINGNHDMIVQDIIPPNENFVKDFFWDNYSFLTNGNLSFSLKYDNRCVSCGVIGMKKEALKNYLYAVDILYNAMENNKLKSLIAKTMILEELTVYLIALKYNYKMYDVLPYNLVLKHGVRKVGDIKKYTHLWTNSKFQNGIVDKIKNKIKKDFSEKYNLVKFYDENIYNKINY